MGLERFAGYALRKALVPQGLANLAWEFGPDLAFAGLTAAAQPEGTSLQDRLLVGAEDFALGGLAGSLGGRAAGAATSLALSQGQRRLQRLDAAEHAAGMGGMIGSMVVPTFAPRPIAEGLRAQEEEKMSAAQRAREEDIYNQGLLASTLANNHHVQDIDWLISQVNGGSSQ
jgi:hypothetical protein